MTYPTNQIPSVNPQNITVSNPVGCEHNPRDPNAQDNTFPPGWEWQNTLSGNFFKCQSATISGAVWVPFAGAGAGTVVELTGNSGMPVGPDGGGNINVVGDGTTITIAGNPGTNTLTASLVGGGVASQSYVTNVSGPVAPTAAGVIDLSASTSTYTDGGTANTVKIELQGTNHTLFVGRGVHAPATTLPSGTANQILVSGGAGSDPSFTSTPTVTSITFGAGTPLSAYVQGTWVPSIFFGGSQGYTNYAFQAAQYNQIGNCVFFTVSITCNTKTLASGAATITGLPIAIGGSSLGGFFLTNWQGITLDAGFTVMSGLLVSGTTMQAVESGSNQTSVQINDTHFGANCQFYGFGFYFTS